MCDFIPFFISQLRGDIREAGQCVDGHVRKAQEVVKDAEMVLSENSIFIKAIQDLFKELEDECLKVRHEASHH